MKDKLDELFENIKHESLSEYERNVSREHLKLFMAEHRAQAPMSVRIYNEVRETFSSFQLVSLMRMHPAALSLVLVLFVGAGTSYAAEGTVPGDTLYPVKVNVNEQVQGALALSPQAKADWNAARVARRLEEAEILGAKGELTAATQSDLETRFDETADDFDANVLALANSSTSPTVVAAMASSFGASLQEHEDALTKVSDSAPTSKVALASIRERVHERAQRIQRVRVVADRFAELRDGRSKDSEVQRGAKTAPVRAASVQISALAGPTSTTEATQAPEAGQSDSVQVSLTAQQSLEGISASFEAAIREAQDDRSGDTGEHGSEGRDGPEVNF